MMIRSVNALPTGLQGRKRKKEKEKEKEKAFPAGPPRNGAPNAENTSRVQEERAEEPAWVQSTEPAWAQSTEPASLIG